jgi:predicted RNA-binding Zn ribbon-like protein
MFTGETLTTTPDPQPGHRPPAPGQLSLVQAFLNTHFDLGEAWGEEMLHSPSALAEWLAQRGLADGGPLPDASDLQRALALRRILRAAVASPHDPHVLRDLSAIVQDAPIGLSFTPSGPRFLPGPGSGTRGAFGVLATVVAAAMLEGTWSRLKLCPGEHCGWAFYDQSRNRSGRWCSMSVCGGRTKARAHYARYRAASGGRQ